MCVVYAMHIYDKLISLNKTSRLLSSHVHSHRLDVGIE